MRLCFQLVFVVYITVFSAVQGNPVKRSVAATVPLTNLQDNTNKATEIGTEQGVVSVAPNTINTNNVHDLNSPQTPDTFATGNEGNVAAPLEETTSAPLASPLNGKPAVPAANTVPPVNGEKPGMVDAQSQENKDIAVPVSGTGEAQQTFHHPNGETETIYNGTPEQVQMNKDKGLKQPVQTIVKPDGEIEKVYDGKPGDEKVKNQATKEATATLAQDTFNISIPLKPKIPPVIKYVGNETGVMVKSPASENFKLGCIREHNKKRHIHQARDLVWSDKLAESAQAWADHLADIDDDVKDVSNRKYGENIFWTRPQLPEDELCKAAVDEWYNEVKMYDFAASHKRHYDSDSVSEFTQLVYDGQTREVGVAFSLSRTNKQYVVARYYKKRLNRLLDMEVHPPHSDKVQVRFDKPVFQTYNMIISLPKTSWLPQYKQVNSPAYQRLKSAMKNAFKATFQDSPTVSSLIDFKLNDFKLDDRKKGSTAILADIDLKFDPHVEDPIQRLRSSIFNGQLNGMDLDEKFLKVFNTTGVYVPPSSWKNKMSDKELHADVMTSGATDPITGQPTKLKYPLPISNDIDLLERKPCQGGTCETYLIKDPVIPENGTSPNIPGLPPGAGAMPPSGGQGGQQCCNQMPPPQPCVALACPPPPSCDPGCPPSGQQGMGQQGMGQQGMGQPGMGQPGMGQPGMGQPGMGHPGMGMGQMGQQGMGQPGQKPPGQQGATPPGQQGATPPGGAGPPPGAPPAGGPQPGQTPPGSPAPGGAAAGAPNQAGAPPPPPGM